MIRRADHLVSSPDREHQFGRGRQKRYDPSWCFGETDGSVQSIYDDYLVFNVVVEFDG